MSTGFTRRSLATGIGTAGLGMGGLAMLAPNALAQTPFTNFAFQATGEPTARTMPDRLSEIKNVLDFGADPTGVSDSWQAIQSAVNWTSGANRGTIFFPIGFYRLSAPITFNYNGPLSICFRGEGVGSVLNCNFSSGFALDRALALPSNQAQVIIEKLWINGAAGPAGGGIRVGSCNSVSVRDCHLGGTTNLTTEDSAGNSSQNILIENVIFPGGTNGLIMGGSGAVKGCDWTSCNVGARMYGNGWFMSGNRMERCDTACLLGLDSAGTPRGASGFAISGVTTEGNWTSMDFSGPCSGFYIGSFGCLGHDSSNAGVTPGIQGTQYGLIVRANMASNGVFNGVSAVGDLFDVAALDLETSTSRANLLFLACIFSKGSSGTGVDANLPTNAYTAQFQNCNLAPVWRYSQLPTVGSANTFEGDEFSISDANTNTWGATVTASGASGHVLVRNNGSNWTVVAK